MRWVRGNPLKRDATTGRDTREALREIEQDAIPRTVGVLVKA